jgi:photosystem II stability/assembly factor-like uncharacterized protein
MLGEEFVAVRYRIALLACLAMTIIPVVQQRPCAASQGAQPPGDQPPQTTWSHIGVYLNSVVFTGRQKAWVAGSAGTLLHTDNGKDWTSLKSGITPHDLNSIFFLRDGQHGWAAGDHGTILATTDGGTTWLLQETPTTATLEGVCFANERWGCAVGIAGTVIFTRDGGQHWKFSDSHTTSDLYAVTVADEEHGWATGAFGTVIFTPDSGVSWENYNSIPTNSTVYGVDFLNLQHGWAVGSLGVTFLTTNGGKDWTRGYCPWPESLDAPPVLRSVYFVDENRGYAVGSNGSIISTVNGGSTWSLEKVATLDSFRSIAINPASRAMYVVGQWGAIVQSSLGNEHWEQQATATAVDLRSVTLVTPKVGWAAGDLGGILRTTDGGETWRIIPTNTDIGFRAIRFLDERTGCAVGDRGTVAVLTADASSWDVFNVPADDDPTLFDAQITQNGEAWVVGDNQGIFKVDLAHRKAERVPISYPRAGSDWAFNSICFTDDGVGWAVGDHGMVMRYSPRSGNNQPRWEPVILTPPTQSILWAVRFDRSGKFGGIIGTGGVTYITRNGGKDWTWEDINTLDDLYAMQFFDDHTAWVFGLGGIEGMTRDQGASWRPVRLNIPTAIYDASFVNDTQGLTVGNDGTVIGTDDGGTHWNILRSYHRTVPHALYMNPKSSMAWAVGDSGMILTSNDRGRTWRRQRSQITSSLNGLFFTDDDSGWAVGAEGVILTTGDGGGHWKQQTSPTSRTLHGVCFDDAGNGWAVGDAGTILFTKNYGVLWNIEQPDSYQLLAVACAPNQLCCAVGGFGTVLTKDLKSASANWVKHKTGTDTTFRSVYVDRGGKFLWAVGDEGEIVSSTDGGEHWDAQESGSKDQLLYVQFSDSNHGWAIGSQASLLSTSDGGKTWEYDHIRQSPYLQTTGFNAIQVLPGTSGRDFDLVALWAAFVMGDKNIAAGLSLGNARIDRPWVDNWFSPTVSIPTKELHLKWHVAGKLAPQFACSIQPLELVGAESTTLVAFPVMQANPLADGNYEATWPNPAREIAAGSKLEFKVFLSDGATPTYSQLIGQPFVYLSVYDRFMALPGWEQSATFLGLLVILIVLLLLLLQWRSPSTIVWLCDQKGLFDFLQEVKYGGPIAVSILHTLVVAPLLTNKRVTTAWSDRCRKGGCQISDLSEATRKLYLDIRLCVSAWADRKLTDFKNPLDRIETCRQVELYVPLAVDVENQQQPVEIPSPSVIRRILRDHNLVAIVGDGGTGKTTLGCQIARWAIEERPGERATEQRMLPVFIEGEFKNLIDEVELQMHKIYGRADFDDKTICREVVLSLLKHGYVLPIVDGLSEKSPETQEAFVQAFAYAEIALVIATSRRAVRVDGRRKVVLRPRMLNKGYVGSYLYRLLRSFGADASQVSAERGAGELSDEDIVSISRKLSEAVGATGRAEITPLLAKIYARQARANLLENRRHELPATVADAMLKFIATSNSGKVGVVAIQDHIIVAAAKILGRKCLGSNYVPQIFDRADAERTLEMELPESVQNPPSGSELIGRFIDIGILDDMGLSQLGHAILRFRLDPLAEYLTAMYLIDKMRDNNVAWDSWKKGLVALPGYPTEIQGFITAFSDCRAALQSNESAIPTLP